MTLNIIVDGKLYRTDIKGDGNITVRTKKPFHYSVCQRIHPLFRLYFLMIDGKQTHFDELYFDEETSLEDITSFHSCVQGVSMTIQSGKMYINRMPLEEYTRGD